MSSSGKYIHKVVRVGFQHPDRGYDKQYKDAIKRDGSSSGPVADQLREKMIQEVIGPVLAEHGDWQLVSVLSDGGQFLLFFTRAA